MASKSIKAILTLKDKNFSSNMKKASKGVKGFNRRLKYSSNQVKKFKRDVAYSFKSVAKSAVGIAGAYLGFRALSNGISESVEAAKAQIDAETKLQAVLKNTKGITDQQIEGLKKYASEQQNLGVIGDEVQIAGIQQIGTFQLQADTIKKLIPGMNDLLAQQKGLNATQQDAVNIGNLIGKVMSGQVGALSRVGISFTKAQEKILKYGTESEKAATLAEVLKQNVGGVNKALAETDQGKIQQMTNAWGDYKEEIGKKILPLQAQFAGWFAKKIPGIQTFTLNLIDKTILGVKGFKKVAISVWIKVKKVIKDNKPVIDNIKNGIKSLGDKVLLIKNWFVDAFQNIKAKIEENKPAIEGVKGVLADLGNKALAMKDWLVDTFESAKPSLNWIKDEGLPLVVDGVAGVIDKATELYNFINDNWSTIEPIILGVAGAITTYKLAVLTTTAVTKGAILVTKGLTLAQGALNTVMNLSPLAKWSIIIGAAIAAGVYLYKNWDTIKAKAGELWEGIKSAFEPLGEFFNGVWEGVKTGFKAFINFFIDGINTVIGGVNSIKVKVPDWVPRWGGKEWGINIPKIPEFALGTSYFKGGLARINERGGEIVNLPNGSQVIPADKSEKIINRDNSKIEVNVIIKGNVIGNEEYAEYIANEIIKKTKLALANG
ncbi:hypothetical protein FQB35_15485 (plasmid) [Crassaminicella thermophila]|uniref:Phage-related protein n=1 Tax=Crassaminicella thermophila TaxID=2599308 RepID=A0A5C0SKR6_CRATE|nr:hypothetical protein [Crassaminicella thermophila]QEK13728.1 hypothetical protein FQB35_15485 [Crassaminicella thermophila]